MKKSLLFLFLLVLGVTQGWAVDYLTLPAAGNNPDDRTVANRTLVKGGTYRVETNTTIDGTKNNAYGLRVPENSTVTIYIAKGKTLLVRGQHGSAQNTPGRPAIEVPSTSTLIITGGGTLRVYGGKAYTRNVYVGGSGAAPAIGGIGGNGGADKKDGSAGTDMGTVYVRGNVTVRAARGTSYGRRATSSRGADGAVPTYAIGGGGGGGAGRKGTGVNGATGNNGALYIEKSARVIYLNGRRDIRNRTVSKFTNPTKLNVQYYVDGTLKTTQVLKEFGTLNVKNEAYSVTTETETLNEDGFTTVTVKNVKSWNTKADGTGDTYNPKDLLVYNNIDRSGASVDFPLYAQWDENSTTSFNGIHDAYELMKFAAHVNANTNNESANGILLADINMAESAWNSTTVARDGKTWGDWSPWVPIGATNNVYVADDHTKRFRGIFDGNGYVVSNITMIAPVGKIQPYSYNRNGTVKEDEIQITANWRVAYDRAGLIGFAAGATIKNVVVKNATLYAKWQAAVVCGRLDLVNGKGSVTNCGSYGILSLNIVTLKGTQGESDYAGNSRVVAGVVTTSTNSAVKSVWSTYSKYVNTASASNNNWEPSKNHVVGMWNSSNNNTTNYNNTLYAGLKTGNESQWVYVDTSTDDGNTTDNSDWLSNGILCHDLNGNLNGATTWTQTFVPDDNKNAENEIVDKDCFSKTNSYADCPRPTSRGLAVYKDADNAYSNHIYTVSFDANGGKENPADIYVRRVYNATTRTLSSESLPGAPTLEEGEIYVFNGWWTDPDGGTEVKSLSVGAINSDMTLYAHWLAGPESIKITAVEDSKNTGNYYSTFYYGEQNYQIETDNVVAYKAYREMNDAEEVSGNDLIMMTLKDGQQHISKVIPAGEAVILKAKSAGGQNKVEIELTAVSSSANDPELDDKKAHVKSSVAN